MNRWAIGIISALVLSSTLALAMVWIAVKNPPELLKRADDWNIKK